MSVLVAAGLDATLGEPRPALHPVVWVGRYLDRAARRVPATPPGLALVAGGVAWGAGAVATVAVALASDRVAARRGRVLALAVRGGGLWPLLSLRLLLEEVAAVESALATSGVGAGRARLGRIVSRDTAGLTADDVRAAAVESLAENLSDSVVAPLVWYVAAGLPGAALYRYANTADACWGYRSDRWVHAGRVAARADDLLNVVPARLTALLLAPGAGRRLRAEAGRTASPNAGWPMAAMALRLDVALAKRRHYTLNETGGPPTSRDVEAALGLARRSAYVALVAAALLDHLIRRPRTGARP